MSNDFINEIRKGKQDAYVMDVMREWAYSLSLDAKNNPDDFYKVAYHECFDRMVKLAETKMNIKDKGETKTGV